MRILVSRNAVLQLGGFLLFALWPILGATQDDGETKKIADTLVRLCLRGGHTEVSSGTATDGSDVFLRYLDPEGRVRGEFKINKSNAVKLGIEFVNSSQVEAAQDAIVTACLTEVWINFIEPELAKLPPRGGTAYAFPPKPPPPPPPNNVPFNAAAYIREQSAQLVSGLIEFNPSPRMRVGEPETIDIRISQSAIEDVITQNLKGRGIPQVQKLIVGTFMRVRLSGEGFKIISKSDENQAVLEKGFTQWLFEVLPVSAGNRKLDLQVAVIFKLPSNTDVPTELPVLRREIAVEVNTLWSVEQFAMDNWKWFLSGIGSVVVAIGGFFGRRWFERSKAG